MADALPTDVLSLRRLALGLSFAVAALVSCLFLSVSRIHLLQERVQTLEGEIFNTHDRLLSPHWSNLTAISDAANDMEYPGVLESYSKHRRMQEISISNVTWKQHTFQPHGIYGFVQFGGYRVDDNQVVAIGLGALAMWGHRQMGQCEWQGDENQILRGNARLVLGGEHHGLMYNVIIIWCYFKGATTPGVGGRAYITLDNEKFMIYSETAGEFPDNKPRRPFRSNITHCSPPIHHGVHSGLVRTWLEYHMSIGFDHFVMYDVGGIDDEMGRILQPFIDAGTVEITDFRETEKYPSWYHGQVLIINDCSYRFRYSSQWVAYVDFDEYIWVKGNKTLWDILEQYKDKAYIQHGTIMWHTKKCLSSKAGEQNVSLVERAVFRETESFCRDPRMHKPTCNNYWGHRKFFTNPRRIVLLENHRVITPEDQGISLSTDIMLHQHLRGMVTRGFGQCSEIVTEGMNLSGLVKDTVVADRVRSLRLNPVSLDQWKERRLAWEAHVESAESERRAAQAPRS